MGLTPLLILVYFLHTWRKRKNAPAESEKRPPTASPIPETYFLSTAHQQNSKRWRRKLGLAVGPLLLCCLALIGITIDLSLGEGMPILHKINVLLASLVISFAYMLYLTPFKFSGASRRKKLLASLYVRLQGGASLSEALRSFPRVFPPFYADSIEVGENSGKLAEALEALSETIQRRLDWTRKWHASFAYLLILFAAISINTTFFVLRIMPQMQSILLDFHVEEALPIPQRGVFQQALYRLLYEHTQGVAIFTGVFPLLLMALTILFIFPVGPIRTLRKILLSGLLFLPLIGPMIVRHTLCQILMMLELLLKAGAPLPQALAMIAEVDLLFPYPSLLRRVRRQVEAGEDLGSAIEKAGLRRLLPPSFNAMILLGEKSGKFEESLGQLRALYAAQAHKRQAIMSQFLLPIGILIAAFFVLLTQLSFFIPLVWNGDALLL